VRRARAKLGLAAGLLLSGLSVGCEAKAPASTLSRSPAPAGTRPIPPQGTPEWPTYHGSYALDGTALAEPPDAPECLFRFKAGVRIDGTPVSGDGKIFFKTEKGTLYALSLSGEQLWKVDSGKDPFSTALLYADGILVAGTSSGKLVAMDIETGKEKWTYEVGSSVQGTPNRIDLAGGGVGVIINSQGDGSIHGVDQKTGQGLWKTDPVERCDGSAGVSKGRIAMGSCASALHLYTVRDSVSRVDVPLGGDCQVAGGVAISGNAAFAGTRSGKVCAVDLGQAKVLWVNEDNQREAFTTPAVNDRLVVFGSDDGKVYALGREKGEKIWEFDTGKKPSSPVLAGRRVAVSSGGTLFLLDAQTGRKIWSAAVSDEITSPALVGGVLLVGADDGTVTAYGRK